MTTYRPPTTDDAAELCALATQMTAGTAFAPPTEEKVRRLIARPFGYGECAVVNGQIVGFMCGYIGETFLNNQVNAYEQGLFVVPEHRGGTISVRLVRNFEQWAKAHGAENLWLSQSVGQKQNSTLSFFERLGYSCQGFITCKSL
jgi:GNAT superfamily N-acetyltransferase